MPKWAYNLSLFAIILFWHHVYQGINVIAAVTVENVAPSDGKLSSLCSSGYHTAPSADLAGFEMACMQPSYSKLLYYHFASQPFTWGKHSKKYLAKWLENKLKDLIGTTKVEIQLCCLVWQRRPSISCMSSGVHATQETRGLRRTQGWNKCTEYLQG